MSDSRPEAAPTSDDMPLEFDVNLRLIAEVAEETELPFPLSLIVGGRTITGLTVSGLQWFEDSAVSIRDNVVEDPSGKFAGALASVFDRAIDGYRQERVDTDPLPVYLHLRDVRIVEGTHTLELPRLRVRVSEVQAWTWGQLT